MPKCPPRLASLGSKSAARRLAQDSLDGRGLLVSALADLASSSVLHFVFSGVESEAQHEHHTREFWEIVIESAFLIVVGSLLFFRARGISAAWHKRA